MKFFKIEYFQHVIRRKDQATTSIVSELVKVIRILVVVILILVIGGNPSVARLALRLLVQ